jgi:hypothetical protein
MTKSSNNMGAPFRGHDRLIMLVIVALLVLIALGGRGRSEARLASMYNFVPTCFLRASTTIVGIIRDFEEHASKLYRCAASSASAVSEIKRALDQSTDQIISAADKGTETPNLHRTLMRNAQRAVTALQRIPHQLISSITSLLEKGVGSVVGIHQPTHTIALGSVNTAAFRTVEQVQPPSSMGTA